MGKDTVCRVDETKSFERKNPLEAIDELYNPNQVLENRIDALCEKVDRLSEILANPMCLKEWILVLLYSETHLN